MSKVLEITGGLLGVSLVGWVAFKVNKNQKDKLASALMYEISKIVSPATNGLQAEDAFDTDYYNEVLRRVKGKVWVMKKRKASDHAARIHSAWGAWYEGGDDEGKVYGVFRALQDKVQVSQVAKAYQDDHGFNLIDKLNERFDETEVNKVLTIVQELPAYRIIK